MSLEEIATTQQTFTGLQDVLKTPSSHVLNTSSTRLQRNSSLSSKTSWRRLDVVLKTSSCLQRRLEDISQDVLKTSWRRFERRKIVTLKTSSRHVFKTSSRHVFKTSWRRLGDKQNVYWGYLYLTNLSADLPILYSTNLYLTNLWRIQNALIRTQ